MRPIRIGLLVPEQGTAGLWAASARACAQLAIEEINQDGGILARCVELLSIDAGPDADSAAAAASDAVTLDRVDSLVGMFPSYARASVISAVAGRVPFIYTPQFEGLEASPDVVTTGETAGELLAPALDWLMDDKGARRFFLCGSAYVWPRRSFATARRLIAGRGGETVGETYTPLGDRNFEAVLSAIRDSRADVVMPHFLGSDAVHFNRCFAASGLAERVARFACAVDETVIYGLGEAETENLFLASAYFSTIGSRNNGAFLERYHGRFGQNPPPANGYGQSCYEGIYGLAALADAAGALDPSRFRRHIGRVRQRRTARGSEAAPLVGARHPIHLARVDGYNVKVLRTLG